MKIKFPELLSRKKDLIRDVSYEELFMEKKRIEAQLKDVEKRMEELEKRKKALFDRGFDAHPIERRILARKIKFTTSLQRVLVKKYEILTKQVMIVDNVETLKRILESEAGKKAMDFIRSIPRDRLLEILAEIDLKGKRYEEMLEIFSRYEGSVTGGSPEEEKYLAIWEKGDVVGGKEEEGEGA